MNRYDRLPIPDCLKEEENSKKMAEIARIIKTFQKQNSLAAFDFRAYKSPGVKETLQIENNDKCCYCGIELANAQAYSEIEHYRQKKIRNITGLMQIVTDIIGWPLIGATSIYLAIAAIILKEPVSH